MLGEGEGKSMLWTKEEYLDVSDVMVDETDALD
jgi:hypothetical protein